MNLNSMFMGIMLPNDGVRPSVLAKVPEIVYCLFIPKPEDRERELDGIMAIDTTAVAAARALLLPLNDFDPS